MRVLDLELAIAAAFACARAATPMSMAAFRDACVAEIHRQRPDVKVEVVAQDELSVSAHGRKISAILGDAYARWALERGRRAEGIA